LALENKWKQMIKEQKIDSEQLEIILNEQIKDNMKQYENMQLILQKAMVFLDDL
jgi:hypothetical protein